VIKLPAAAAVAPASDPRLHEAARAMESMLLKQIVVASGAFKGGAAAGSAVRADLFAQTLSDALTNGGGIGLAAMLERSLGGGPPSTGPAAPGGAGALRTLSPDAGSGPVPRLLLLSSRAPATAPGTALTPPTGTTLASPARGGLALSVPLAGAPTSSPFGVRADPFTGHPAHHAGLDLAAPEGTPVESSAPGLVVQAGPRPGYGLAVEIDHGLGITTLYAHASEILVQAGQRVERGEAVARVGETGRSTGPHLHFEVRTQGTPVDPRRALNAYQSRVDESHGSGILTAARTP